MRRIPALGLKLRIACPLGLRLDGLGLRRFRVHAASLGRDLGRGCDWPPTPRRTSGVAAHLDPLALYAMIIQRRGYETKKEKRPKLDTDRIDDAVLALMHRTLHDGGRVWKGFDWETMNRPFKKAA